MPRWLVFAPRPPWSSWGASAPPACSSLAGSGSDNCSVMWYERTLENLNFPLQIKKSYSSVKAIPLAAYLFYVCTQTGCLWADEARPACRLGRSHQLHTISSSFGSSSSLGFPNTHGCTQTIRSSMPLTPS